MQEQGEEDDEDDENDEFLDVDAAIADALAMISMVAAEASGGSASATGPPATVPPAAAPPAAAAPAPKTFQEALAAEGLGAWWHVLVESGKSGEGGPRDRRFVSASVDYSILTLDNCHDAS